MDKHTIGLESDLDRIENIDDFIHLNKKHLNTEDFHSYLIEMVKLSGLTIKDIIAGTYIDQSYCYQIFRGIRIPNRDKIIQLCFAMNLDLQKVNRLLKLAGKNPLYVKDLRDAIITFALKKSKSLDELETLLSDKNQDSLC